MGKFSFINCISSVNHLYNICISSFDFLLIISISLIHFHFIFSEQKELKSLNDVTSLIFKFGNDVGARNANGKDPYLTIEGKLYLSFIGR